MTVGELLLRGSLGAYFRDLLRECTLPGRVSGMFELIDEQYLADQIRCFRNGDGKTNYGFISRLAALELWSRTVTGQKSIPLA